MIHPSRPETAVACDLPERGHQPAALYADKHLRIDYDLLPGSLRFRGEIDAWNLDGVVAALARRVPEGDVHFELSQLSFSDVSGIRALAAVGWNLKSGRRLVFHGLAPQLRTVLTMVGRSQVPNLTLCDCGREA